MKTVKSQKVSFNAWRIIKKMSNTFNTIPEALSAIQNGEMIIVVDEPDRENEGDLIMSAEKVTAERINFMAKYGRGLICLPTCSERLAELELYPMVASNTEQMQTAFTVTIDAKEVKTGISAQGTRLHHPEIR